MRFELGLGGVFCLVVVCFIAFLWMFFLGIWAGQTILGPETENWGALSKFTASLRPVPIHEMASEQAQPPSPSQPERPLPPTQKGPEWAESETSYFCLQVGAFQDLARAEKAIQEWRVRGYDVFAQPPDEDDAEGYTRIFVGKFDKLAEANQMAELLEKQHNVKAYIALLPGSKIKLP